MIISYIEVRHFHFMNRGLTFYFHVQRADIFFSCIEVRHFLFMDRGHTFFSMDEAKIFFHTWSRPEFCFSKFSNCLLVAPLFIDEENSKLPPKYSNCVTFVAFCHS